MKTQSLLISVILLNIFFIINSYNLFSQVTSLEPIYWLGIYGDYDRNLHFPGFGKLPGNNDSLPEFDNSVSGGLSIGTAIEIPIEKNLSLEFRLGFSNLDGSFSKSMNGGRTLLKLKNSDSTFMENVLASKELDAHLDMIYFEPIVNLDIFQNLRTSIGFKFGWLLSSTYDTREKLLSYNASMSPLQVIYAPDVTLADGRIYKNEVKGLMINNKNSFQVAGDISIGYEIKLGKYIRIIPEIRYSFPFTNITSVPWKISQLQMGTSLQLAVHEEHEKPIKFEKEIYRDTTVIAVLGLPKEKIELKSSSDKNDLIEYDEYKLNLTIINEHYEKQIPKAGNIELSLNTESISKDGKRDKNPTILIEETEVEETFPMLPQVFFNENNSELEKTNLKLLNPEATTSFDENDLKLSSDINTKITQDIYSKLTLDIYSNILNIIGSRLKKKPDANLILTGCNSNLNQEKNNLKLSSDRAEAIKSYLVNIWGIESNRIIIKKQNLPDKPSNSTSDDGITENRRVELSSKDISILQPVTLKRVQKTTNTPNIEISNKVSSDLPIKSWSIDVTQGGNKIRHYENSDKKDIPNIHLWKVEEQPVPEADAPLDIRMSVTDEMGQMKQTSTTIKLNQLTLKKKRFDLKEDKRIEKFSLIVFDFDKSTVTNFHKDILDKVKERIKPSSIVTISGYTDRTGEALHNKDLAQRRCEEVKKYLGVSSDKLTMNPVGSDELLFDNNTPQGRSYCRTVRIIVETPTNE